MWLLETAHRLLFADVPPEAKEQPGQYGDAQAQQAHDLSGEYLRRNVEPEQNAGKNREEEQVKRGQDPQGTSEVASLPGKGGTAAPDLASSGEVSCTTTAAAETPGTEEHDCSPGGEATGPGMDDMTVNSEAPVTAGHDDVAVFRLSDLFSDENHSDKVGSIGFPDVGQQVFRWPPLPPSPPPSTRPSVSTMIWPSGSTGDAEATCTRYATAGSDDAGMVTDTDESSVPDESGSRADDVFDEKREDDDDDLLPPRRAGVGTSRVSELRKVLLAQASPFALRAAMWRGPELDPLLDQSAREGPARGGAGGGPDAGKATGVEAGAVPVLEQHPHFIEDLKAFLGEKTHTKQVELEPSLASPEQPQRTVAEAMSEEGPELRHVAHEAGAEAGTQPAALAASASGASGTISLSNVCPIHGQSGGPISVEDKCLECCVYYGVMCCQCSIL
ncbi:Putative methyltransferase cpaM [Frankliniella fusca]|uniref:Methyltransferase cpaM n=1 Tax=Frankliniella fusca TaxID=407009 RepID=A0AAE1LFT0_9NEOP|nr:Putative methyltransferase cpaM [Frankliniella fusca]